MCIGAFYYKYILKSEYSSIFMYCAIPKQQLLYLTNNFYNINYDNVVFELSFTPEGFTG